MSSFITRFLASMSMKDSKSTQPAEARPRRHERSSRNHHHRSSRHSQYRSSYVYDSDETEVETDDEPPANSLMLDLGPDYSPKAMSTISFPSPPTRGGTLLFETDEMDNSPQHIETRQPSAAAQAIPSPPNIIIQRPPHKPRQQRGRSSSRSSTGSQQHERRASRTSAYIAGSQWVW
ncbi:hypothetical protein RhiXN_07194 [Rhizoctonia solani]|uniref:Uncharacterized protein n=1 Tax=Rhizoctonia solani TaxID=456999 RepID=A0A8H8P651_9AGAM|nr:uncharacterized protein RhiXN_07194 [Rhizoctonia solani]QRW25245.1 hypothetical protein RhiXN_07194 [Rhizoctonia solani]